MRTVEDMQVELAKAKREIEDLKISNAPLYSDRIANLLRLLDKAKHREMELIQVMDPAKSVRYGSYGCLTDECDHWNDKTCTTESRICLLGRVLTQREMP